MENRNKRLLKILTKKFLVKKYIKNKKNITQIAKEVRCSIDTIWNRLKKYNIPRRTISETRTKFLSNPENHPFFGKKGKLAGNYIDGRSLKKYYCKDCRKKINWQTAIEGQGRCGSCEFKRRNYKGRNNPMFGKVTHGKWGKYKGINMRSSYEIIYAKWLDHCKVKWQYESKTFDLGNNTYTPDFYLPDRDRYIEVKGYWRDDAKKKYKLFRRKYPNIKLSLIIEPEIRRMKRDLNL